MKCYVRVDLKMGKITHQDVGQIDMYVRMYDDLKRTVGDNPTIGILLCSETDEDIVRYSVLHDNDRLFMSKYLTYLPTKEQLRQEIERQKEIFYMQHPLQIEDGEVKLCPNGVECKTLGEIAIDIFRGADIKHDEITEEGIPCVRTNLSDDS